MNDRIGELLLARKLINLSQMRAVLEFAERSGLRFCEAALQLAVVDRAALLQAFAPASTCDLFHLKPELLPEVTRDLMSEKQVLRYGALGLGIKDERRLFRNRRTLNIGMIDPSRIDVANRILWLANNKLGAGRIDCFRVYLLLVDQYLEVVSHLFGSPESSILSAFTKDELDPLLARLAPKRKEAA